MITSAIRLVSKALCLLFIVSFAMFAMDELSTTGAQQAAVANGTAKAQVVRDVHGREYDPYRHDLRIRIDNMNDAVLGPAEKVVSDQNPWILRGVPFALGILLFGFGGHMLASWLVAEPKRKISAKPIDHEFRPRYTPGYR